MPDRQRSKTATTRFILLDAEIVKKTEQYLKELKEERTKTWRNLKADVNIPQKGSRSGLSPLQGGARSELRTQPNDSDAMDSLVGFSSARCTLALHPGETVDWVAAINREDDPAMADKHTPGPFFRHGRSDSIRRIR